MDDRPSPQHPSPGQLSHPLIVTGLGPGNLARAPAEIVDALRSTDVTVLVRTLQHPAAEELAAQRSVITCDDLYESAETFEEVYAAIAERVLEEAEGGPVIYAVPGSPLYAERSVVELRRRARRRGVEIDVRPAPSFLDEVFAVLEIDPGARGFQVLDGRDLPDPLILQLPTVVFHVDVPVVLADVIARLGRTMPDETPITVLAELGTDEATVTEFALSDVPMQAAGLRTSLFFDPPDVGIAGVITAMRRLRLECPWDRDQTHDSLAPYAIEETFELVEAISRMPAGLPAVAEPDYGAYAEVEEELGDVLLQVIFHSNLAAEVGAFDIEDVAETLRRKLVRRHPHVFGDVEVADVDEVVSNWQAIKADEKPRDSLMDGIPESLPALLRAVKLQKRAGRVGFDWPSAAAVVGDVREELSELVEVLDQPEAADELGDLLFAVTNLARHLNVDPELALRRAVGRFESRFRRIEQLGDLEAAGVDEMNRLWEQAKKDPRLQPDTRRQTPDATASGGIEEA